MPARRLAARWVIPVEGRPIEHGAVLIGADGRVIAVGPDAMVPRPAEAVAETYEHGLLLPGLINTHTHLELTGLSGEPPEPDFAAWILGVRRLKAGRSPEAFLAAARAGLAASHAAESRAESELLARGEGAFAEAWRGRGIPLPAPLGRSPVEWLDDHGVLSERTLCIHLVQAGTDDVNRLARAGAAVAHCPLSNRRHGHGVAPLAAFIERKLRVGLGTDS